MRLLTLLLALTTSIALAQVKVYAPEAKTSVSKAKIIVKVNTLTEVDGPRVLLGDIAEIAAGSDWKTKLEQIDFGIAPVAGVPRPIVATRIQSLLMIAGLKTKDFEIQIPTDAKVALKVQRVALAQFVESATAAVQQLVGPQVKLLHSQAFPDFIAPVGDLVLEPGRAQKNTNGYAVLVSVLVNGKKVNSRLIQLTVDPLATAGAVKAGDTVKILLRSAGATIEVSGKARTSGFVGQVITVVASTGSIHQATVISASEVEVKV